MYIHRLPLARNIGSSLFLGISPLASITLFPLILLEKGLTCNRNWSATDLFGLFPYAFQKIFPTQTSVFRPIDPSKRSRGRSTKKSILPWPSNLQITCTPFACQRPSVEDNGNQTMSEFNRVMGISPKEISESSRSTSKMEKKCWDKHLSAVCCCFHCLPYRLGWIEQKHLKSSDVSEILSNIDNWNVHENPWISWGQISSPVCMKLLKQLLKSIKCHLIYQESSQLICR